MREFLRRWMSARIARVAAAGHGVVVAARAVPVWLSAIGVAGVVALGFTMIQVDEYAAATALWCLGFVVVMARAVATRGTTWRYASAVALVMTIILCRWTGIKRGEKPWSAFATLKTEHSRPPAQREIQQPPSVHTSAVPLASVPASRTAPLRPAVEVVFKESPRLTPLRKLIIKQSVNDYYSYLKRLHIDPPRQFPPIGVSHSGVRSTTYQGSWTVFDQSIYLPERSLENRSDIASAYSAYTFDELLGAHFVPGQEHETAHRITASIIFNTYFFSNFEGRPRFARGPSGEWGQAIWALRRMVGVDYVNRAMVYALKCFGDKEYFAPTNDFNLYFSSRFLRGEMVIDNQNEHAPASLQFLRTKGLVAQN